MSFKGKDMSFATLLAYGLEYSEYGKIWLTQIAWDWRSVHVDRGQLVHMKLYWQSFTVMGIQYIKINMLPAYRLYRLN